MFGKKRPAIRMELVHFGSSHLPNLESQSLTTFVLGKNIQKEMIQTIQAEEEASKVSLLIFFKYLFKKKVLKYSYSKNVFR